MSQFFIYMKFKYLLLIGLIFILPISLPLLHKGFFPMHDFTHVARLAELDRGLKAGQIPARWSDNFGWGYGMPLMHFYAPLFYYLGEIFYLIGIPAVTCIKIAIFIALLLGFIFSFKLGKEFFGKLGGILTAVAFTYAPYRAVQIYVRGALTEMLATTFIPLALLTLYLLIKNSFAKKIQTNLILGFALSLTGIFLSHNVITIITFPLLFIWGLGWIIYFTVDYGKFKLKTFLAIFTGGVIGFLLSAWFLIPAFFEKEQTIVSSIAGGYSYYKLHFVYFRQLFQTGFRYGGSILGPDDDISFSLGIGQLILLAISSLIFLHLVWKKRKQEKENLVLFLLLMINLGLFIFMMSFHSTYIWEKINILHMAQFPWRFLSLNIAILSLLIGFVAYSINRLKNKHHRFIASSLVLLLLIITNLKYFHPEKYLYKNELYYTDTQLIQTHMSGILKDYLPKTAKESLAIPVSEIQLNNQTYNPVNLIVKNAYRKFNVDSENGGIVVMPIYDFLGWQVNIDGQIVPHSTDPLTGLISFELPAGGHIVTVELAKTKLQKLSDSISLLSWIALFIAIVYQNKGIKISINKIIQ